MAKNQRTTAISKVGKSGYYLRGYRVDELCGSINFAQLLSLAWLGEIPEANVSKLLEAVLIALCEEVHDSPATVAVRSSVIGGTEPSVAAALGLCATNNPIAETIEDVMRVLYTTGIRINQGATMDQAAAEIVSGVVELKRRLPGIVLEDQADCSRAIRLQEIANQSGYKGRYMQAITLMSHLYSKVKGKHYEVGTEGVAAAILCELGFSTELASAIAAVARLPVLIAHAREEKERGSVFGKGFKLDVIYNGPPDRTIK